MKHIIAGLMILMATYGVADAKPKVLYIDSYHSGYAWSDGIYQGVVDVLGDKVNLQVIRMDTKRNPSIEFKKLAARKVIAKIKSYQPDAVIAADDNASEYVIAPYYKDTDLPIVFCGLNWDASRYGFPCSNVTGMIEISPIQGLLRSLYEMAEGTRVGLLGPDVTTVRKDVEVLNSKLKLEAATYFATDVEDWKNGFIKLQREVDVLVLLSDGGLYNQYIDDLKRFVLVNTKVPTGTVYDFMSKYALIAFAKVASEQGEWAAQAALKILDGTPVSSIGISHNKKGHMILNFSILEATQIEVPQKIIRMADRASDYE
jgi:ABC-type uncharacterized transport system substrate-binding protein